MSKMKDEYLLRSGTYEVPVERLENAAYRVGRQTNDMIANVLAGCLACDTSFEPFLEYVRGARQ